MAAGSPPRVRGKGKCPVCKKLVERITPARAGKRKLRGVRQLANQDHPRACGEKQFMPYGLRLQLGSPPRVRGKVVHPIDKPSAVGITPARAGKSSSKNSRGGGRRDHPRACGEKAISLPRLGGPTGSPPRVRGKAGLSQLSVRDIRITPARAGKRAAGAAAG